MKTKYSALLAIVTGWLLLVAVQLSVAQSVPPVKIILDTDMAADCDDLGAVAVLHSLANQGKADILGMVCNVSDTNSPRCLSAINTYYGRPNIPIGYLNNNGVSPTVGLPYYNKYTDYIADTNNYARSFLTNDVPDALAVYTNLLENSSNVTIVCVGSFYNLYRLLTNAPVLVSNRTAVYTTPRTTVYQDGNWHHAAAVRLGTNALLYIDGVLVVQASNQQAYQDIGSSNPLKIGRRFVVSEPADYYSGELDELRIYNRALSASEVAQLYTLNWQPTLGAIRQGGKLVFSWPTNVPTFTLVSATNLGPSAVWTPVSPAPVVVNDQFFVTNSLSEPSMFFRLRGP